MPSFRRLQLPAAGIASLAWDGDHLVDWLNTCNAYGLDGSVVEGRVRYGYRFDAVASLDGYTVLYERRGTKGLVIHGDRVLREIDRSYYQANAYDYPITLFRLADGCAALAHCPTDYNRLDIDLLETGERLTAREKGEADDVFHSGLAVDPSGAWLMSAGWVWHPAYVVGFHHVADVLRDPMGLDRDEGEVSGGAEIAFAAFLDADRVVLASAPDAELFYAEDDPDLKLPPGAIGVYRPATKTWDSLAKFAEPAGRLLAVDAEHVLALFEHPKLIHVPTGKIVERWPDIRSGSWAGCILGPEKEPPIAWDPLGKRLAVASENAIDVLVLA